MCTCVKGKSKGFHPRHDGIRSVLISLTTGYELFFILYESVAVAGDDLDPQCSYGMTRIIVIVLSTLRASYLACTPQVGLYSGQTEGRVRFPEKYLNCGPRRKCCRQCTTKNFVPKKKVPQIYDGLKSPGK